MTNFSATAANTWAVVDMLRGDSRQSRYGRVILPFTLLRRFECVLEPTRDADLDAAKNTHMGEVGIAGYKIPFNRHFCKYVPLRPLDEIDADLDKASAEIMARLREVHS